jgi:predicted DCC family thiol-disulfide oxidoreductase YuxK
MCTGERSAVEPSPALPGQGSRLTVLYDERCAFCLRCRDWLAAQPCLVPVELLASGSDEARSRYDEIPWLGSELVVVDDEGQVWVGPAAFLICLWATARYRAAAYFFAQPRWSGQAERFFMHVSKRRDKWASWLTRHDRPDDCSWCDEVRVRWDA